MHAAVIEQAHTPPVLAEIADPPATAGLHLVRVAAAALSHVTRSRAAGRHYSAAPGRHLVPGVDGSGRLEDGRRVYFLLPEAPYGSMAERTLVAPANCIELPAALSDVTAAAIGIPGMSSWAALTQRARMVAGATVLVNGATGMSGRLAVQIARRLGAARVIATGRDAAALAALESLGADATIALGQPAAALSQALQAQFGRGVDIVLDYLWGPSAEAILEAAARAAPAGRALRHVQIGTAGGADNRLDGAVLRSSAIELLGSGLNSVPPERLRDSIRALFASAADDPFEAPVRQEPLARVAELWDVPGACPRIVFTTADQP